MEGSDVNKAASVACTEGRGDTNSFSSTPDAQAKQNSESENNKAKNEVPRTDVSIRSNSRSNNSSGSLLYHPWTWIAVAFGAAAAASSLSKTTNLQVFVWQWIVYPAYRFIVTCLGVAAGVGLGLGFAAHVYDQLTVWHERSQQHQAQNESEGPATAATAVTTSSSNEPAFVAAAVTHQFRKTTSSVSATAALLPQDDYKSLMQSAGYLSGTSASTNKVAGGNRNSNTARDVLRGQVVARRTTSAATAWLDRPTYAFDEKAHADGAPRHAAACLQDLWPALPAPVTEQLGYLLENILRDFVACWYKSVDEGVLYKDLQNEAPTVRGSGGGGGANGASKGNDDADATTTQQQKQQQQYARVMMYSLGRHRSSPFLDALYESMSILFGNLATRMEHLNLFHIILLQWTKVLAHTFKVYRTLRRSVVHKHRLLPGQQQLLQRRSHRNPAAAAAASTTTAAASGATTESGTVATANAATTSQEQQQQKGDATATTTAESFPSSTPVSEIAMIKEFLLLGKLHRAITFGLDVPALLFADASGKECGTPSSDANGEDVISPPPSTTPGTDTIDDRVLEDRLFRTNLLQECELDYNRVVGHRMVRALLTRHDFGSPIVATLLTEVMGGCVLTPVMGVFCPAYLNSWIIKGLSSSEEEESAAATANETEANQEEGRENKAAGDNGDDQQLTEPTVDPLLGTVDKSTPVAAAQTTLESLPEDAPVVQQQTTTKAPTDSLLSPEQMALDDISDNAAQLLSSSSHHRQNAGGTGSTSDVGSNSGDGVVASMEDNIISLLALALIDLQKYVDFEECRLAREQNREVLVNWDDPGCRAAVLRLVLVLELALTHGRCTYKHKRQVSSPTERQATSNGQSEEGDNSNSFGQEEELDEEEEDMEGLVDDSEQPVEVTLTEYESLTLSQILMEMTGDIDAFEERVATENTLAAEMNANKYEDMEIEEYKPTPTEQSTLRTLLAAWLHTGQIYRTVTVLVQAHATVLAPYYHNNAFLRSRNSASGFVRQLRALAGVDILVDTMTVLACPRLDETDNEALLELIRKSTLPSPRSSNPDIGATAAGAAVAEDQGDGLLSTRAANSISAAQLMASSSTPRYLDFNRNESFASSLRSERDRRTLSWQAILAEDDGEATPVCSSSGMTQEDIGLHRELHHIARIFYTGTNIIGIRDAARRKNSREGEGGSVSESGETEDIQVSLLTVETACPRRRIEVPDDDSSFLLRAQSRTLNAVGVHRDQRNHDQSFKCFAATYEEPALNASTEHYTGGRYVRRCLIRYYPIDRTASVSLQNDARKLDQRRRTAAVPETITLGNSSRPTPFLSADFLRERHLCQRWVPKGTARSQSILASSVVEPADFTSTPRTGKAFDFVYKVAFFEKPMINLGGKHFAVHDASALGVHRADASAMEISDASLSAALLTLGETFDETDASSSGQHGVQMGKDGYPVIWMKFSRKQDDAHVEVKPYRASFARAALMITAARQEAQLQSLVKCVRAGSAKKATKALTDAQLKPTLKLVEYAGSSREKQSVLLRDLKLGVNHIDREQLRRNGLLSPRFPTEIMEFGADVEDAVQAADDPGDFFGATVTLYKVRCVAKVRFVARDDDLDGTEGYRLSDGKVGQVFQEEWVVYRSFKEFQTLHKHLKTQVSTSMSSGTAGSRLVGAATAAFASSAAPNHRLQRQSLIPSLSQASKAGALGVTKKSILRRKDILNGYIGYLLAGGNPMSRNCELLLFLGAFYPFPPSVRVGQPSDGGTDPLGRSEMSREVVQSRVEKLVAEPSPPDDTDGTGVPPSPANERRRSTGSDQPTEDEDQRDGGEERESRRAGKNPDMIPAIRAKIDRVPLAQVRNRLFELLRNAFGFDNASFIRNRMLAALKTASFAVTSAAEFRRTLYKLHVEHLSGKAVADLIHMGIELLWPDGVFFTSAPPWSQEELDAQVIESKKVLQESFPEQVRAILGQELTEDGISIFHEMLQNRVVVKSMFYMFFDLLWLEVFPEIGDVLQCGAALDVEQ